MDVGVAADGRDHQLEPVIRGDGGFLSGEDDDTEAARADPAC